MPFYVNQYKYRDRPTKYPTESPSKSPSKEPTASPTACIDYGNYNSLDGQDNPLSVSPYQLLYYQNYSYTNISVQWFIADHHSDNNYYGESIVCNHTNSEICFVGCYYNGGCAETVINPVIMEIYLN